MRVSCYHLMFLRLRPYAWFPVLGFALTSAGIVQGEDLYSYVTNADNTITITSYVGRGYLSEGVVDLTITNMIDGMPVTGIGDFAFDHSYCLSSVTIPNSVTSIGNYAFGSCLDMGSVFIPDSVTSMGHSVFEMCQSLVSVTLPANITSIGAESFAFCQSLAIINIPSSVTNIEDNAFFFCTGLISVYFLGNAPTVGVNAFYDSVNSTAYYLPNMTGWDSCSLSNGDGDIPLVCWNPKLTLSDSLPLLDANGCHFGISGSTNIPIVVQTCTNLQQGNWFTLQSLMLTNGLSGFTDPNATSYPACFYRISMP